MMIAKKSIKIVATLVIALFSVVTFAQHGGEHHEDSAAHESHASHGGQVNTPNAIKAYIEHHLYDSYDFSFFSYTDAHGERKHFGFPLPVIFWDNGLKVFSSSKFHHGEAVVEKDGAYYKLFGNNIFKTDKHGTISSIAKDGSIDTSHDAHKTGKIQQEKVLLNFSITKNVFGILLAGLLLFLGFSSLARGYKKGAIPTGFARVLEPLVIYVRDDIARPNIGEKHYRKFMGFLLTVFFFIWIINLLGLTPLGFNISGNIAVTVCLALFTFFIVQFSGNKEYWKHIFWMPGVPPVMKIILAPIEVLGMFTKPFSLLIRLFANMTAGHFVVMTLIALMITMKAAFGPVASTGMSLVLSLFISVIEILVAFLQAFIFTMLSSLFIGMAVAEHDHH